MERKPTFNVKKWCYKFFEIGPEKALTGMTKRTIEKAKCFSINSIDDMKKFKMNLKIKKYLSLGQQVELGIV